MCLRSTDPWILNGGGLNMRVFVTNRALYASGCKEAETTSVAVTTIDYA